MWIISFNLHCNSGEGIITTPVSQMGKLRLGEIKEQILGHMKSTFWGQEI